jgi:hypothetical protein
VDTLRSGGKAVSLEKAAPEKPAAGPESSSPAGANTTARPPRFVVLFFDDADTNTGDLTHAQIAARRFVKEALSPGDRVAIMTSSSAQSLEFTTDVAKMVETIGRLKAHLRIPESGLAACPRITPYQAFLISAKMDGMALKAAVDEAYACADLDRAVMSEEILGGFGVAVSVQVGPPVSVTANVDVTKLRFAAQDGRRVQHLTFVAALVDAQGNVAAAKEGAMELALTDATFARLALTGLNAKLTLEAPPGTYRLREVVQEGLDGGMASALLAVTIPAR